MSTGNLSLLKNPSAARSRLESCVPNLMDERMQTVAQGLSAGSRREEFGCNEWIRSRGSSAGPPEGIATKSGRAALCGETDVSVIQSAARRRGAGGAKG